MSSPHANTHSSSQSPSEEPVSAQIGFSDSVQRAYEPQGYEPQFRALCAAARSASLRVEWKRARATPTQVGTLAWQRTTARGRREHTEVNRASDAVRSGAGTQEGSFETCSDGVQHGHGATTRRELEAPQVDHVSQRTRGGHRNSTGSEVVSATSRSNLHGTRPTGGYTEEPCSRLPQILPLCRSIVPPAPPRTGGTLLGLPGTQGARTVHQMHIDGCSPVVRVHGGRFRNRTAPQGHCQAGLLQHAGRVALSKTS